MGGSSVGLQVACTDILYIHGLNLRMHANPSPDELGRGGGRYPGTCLHV